MAQLYAVATLEQPRRRPSDLPISNAGVAPRLIAWQHADPFHNISNDSDAPLSRIWMRLLLRSLLSLPVVCLTIGTLSAANDPFVGKWKVNPSKSKLYDEMKVEAAGANRFTFTFGPDQVDTVVADGSDQPALNGTTLSITVKGPNSWEVVRKMKGRQLLRAEWTLSEDGKTLNDAFTQYLPSGVTLFSEPLPDGSTLFLPYVYDRTAGNSGFPGMPG